MRYMYRILPRKHPLLKLATIPYMHIHYSSFYRGLLPGSRRHMYMSCIVYLSIDTLSSDDVTVHSRIHAR